MGEIANEFLSGMQEIFKIMFGTEKEHDNTLYFYFLDKEKSKVDTLYNESSKRVFHNPKVLASKVNVSQEDKENYIRGLSYSLKVTVPTKELIDNKIGHVTSNDLQALYEGLLVIGDKYFEVRKDTPSTLIDGIYQVYKFDCTEVVDRSRVELVGEVVK